MNPILNTELVINYDMITDDIRVMSVNIQSISSTGIWPNMCKYGL